LGTEETQDAAHPSEQLLYYFGLGRIPTPQGDALRRAIASHVDRCSRCADLVNSIVVDLARAVEISVVHEIARQLAEVVRLRALRVAPTMHQAGRPPKGAFRGTGDTGDAEGVDALVMDQSGQLMIEPTGRARVVRFSVLKAAIGTGGAL